jgi:hypothetical protein
MRISKLGCAIVAAMLCMTPLGARAAHIAFDLSIEYSGGTPPEGASPWLRVELDDGGGAGSVTMTMTATNLTGTEFVTDWRLNLDPALNPADLDFSTPTKTGTFADPVISTGTNFSMAPGDGLYDILVAFDNAPPGNRFGAGESVQYVITGIPTLTANSFAFLSAPQGGHGPFHTAAHVQGIGDDGEDSGQITNGQIIIVIPEPAGLTIAAIALAGLVSRRRAR